MQEAGSTIGLHGYDHVCSVKGRSLLPLHRMSEFAGRPYEEQRSRIAAGLAVLKKHGLETKIFVAPRHGLDRNTLRAISSEHLFYLSDGFATRPFRRGGATWIPQQLWRPVWRARGLWTICVHPNSTGPVELNELRVFLERHASRFASFDEVISVEGPGRLSPLEFAREQLAMWRVALRSRLLGQLR